MTGVLSGDPAAVWWFRGKARREGEDIVFDGRTAEGYDLSAQQRVGLKLARVRTPEDAVAFVAANGPLVSFRDDRWTDANETWARLQIRPAKVELTSTFERREPLEDVLHHARMLEEILRLAMNARKAADGDGGARVRLEEAIAIHRLPDETISDSPELWASRLTAHWLTIQLRTARPFVANAGRPGRFEVRLLPDTLLGFCYLTVAHALGSLDRLGICQECGRVFAIEDSRQKFCVPACANRARFRRFSERRGAKGGLA